MAEIAIPLHGPTGSLDHRSGPVVALVEVEGGSARYSVDPERNRVRLDAIPGPDPDKWVSGSGLLLIARRGWWGTMLRSDTLPIPSVRPRDTDAPRKRRRPHLPRDLAGCTRCGRIIVVERSNGGDFIPVTPSRRLAARVASILAAAGLPAPLAKCHAVGLKAGRLHRLDCHGFGFT